MKASVLSNLLRGNSPVETSPDLKRMADQVEAKNALANPNPSASKIQPWDLIEHMSGSDVVLADHLRASAIEKIWQGGEGLKKRLEVAVTEINKAISLLP